jgi:hypothetical protein
MAELDRDDRGPLRGLYAAMTVFVFALAFATVVPMLVHLAERILGRGRDD